MKAGVADHVLDLSEVVALTDSLSGKKLITSSDSSPLEKGFHLPSLPINTVHLAFWHQLSLNSMG